MSKLTDKHRVVVRFSNGTEYEMGLYEGPGGGLRLDTGAPINNNYPKGDPRHFEIVEVIEPEFTPKEGMTIFNPENRVEHLTYLPNNAPDGVFTWAGFAPVTVFTTPTWDWFTERWAETLVTKHGWQVLGA